ncbi:MAG: hypothetical protein ACI8XM_001912 [Haloarculaceae archaeon]|jgi:hypothetical protein
MVNQNHLLVAGLVGAIVVAGGLMFLVGGNGNTAAPDGGTSAETPAQSETPAQTATPAETLPPERNSTATPAVGGNQTPGGIDSPVPDSLDLTATPIADGKIRVTFNNVHRDAEEYVVLRGREGSGSAVYGRFQIDDRTEFTYTDSETNPGTTYYYAVVPKVDGESVAPVSDRVVATADASRPDVVSNGSFLTVLNQSEHRIRAEFRTSEELNSISATIDGPVSIRLNQIDFVETNLTGEYRYATNVTVPDNGTYTGTLTSITDLRGNERTPGLTDQFTIDNTRPEILSYNVTQSGPQSLTVKLRASEQLDRLEVEADPTARSTETVVISRDEFTEVSTNGTYTYTTTQRAPSFDIYIVTLQRATDSVGNGFAGVFGETVALRP